MEYIFGILTENTESILTVPVPFSEEYKPYFMDLFRMIAIQTMVNIMFYLSDPVKNSLFSGTYIKTLFFVLLGVSVYWLVFRNLITLKYEGGSNLLTDTQVAEEVAEVAETAAL